MTARNDAKRFDRGFHTAASYLAMGALLASLGGLSAAAQELGESPNATEALGGAPGPAQEVRPSFLCSPVNGGATPSDAGTATPSDNCATCNSYVDATTFLMPNYAGWQTAKQTDVQTAPSPGTTYTRKLLYGTNKFELIKFNDPHSSETYTWDNTYIYLTAENGINGGSQSRVYPAGSDPMFRAPRSSAWSGCRAMSAPARLRSVMSGCSTSSPPATPVRSGTTTATLAPANTIIRILTMSPYTSRSSRSTITLMGRRSAPYTRSRKMTLSII